MKDQEKVTGSFNSGSAGDVSQGQADATANGGQTTNSPPWKRLIQSEMGYALASGVDRLVLAVDFNWKDRAFFQGLEELKAEAAANECSMPGAINETDGQPPWAYQVEAFGNKGYQWLLKSPEYDLKVGNWLSPRSRPSVMIDIHSEALWIQGAVEAIDRILTLLKSVGAYHSAIKLSRVDVCLDLLVQAPLWNVLLREHVVSRARKISINEDRRQFTGLEIGKKGALIARLYDKGLEIRTISKKDWMYDIWNLEEVPENFRVVRIEFQLRREVGKELGLDSVWHFTNHPRNLWAYCTQCWLKFTDNPLTETRFQTVLPFWKTVQDNFLGNQHATPLVRAKAVNVKRKQLAQQLMGQFTSLIAIGTDNMAPCVRLEDHLAVVTDSAQMLGLDDYALSQRVRRKQGKYLKAIEKFKTAEEERKKLGLPCNQDPISPYAARIQQAAIGTAAKEGEVANWVCWGTGPDGKPIVLDVLYKGELDQSA
jgi:hypothetical protein